MKAFGLQQLANSAQGAQADPERELGFFFQRPNAFILLTCGEGVVVGRHLLEALVQFQELRGRKDAPKACIKISPGYSIWCENFFLKTVSYEFIVLCVPRLTTESQRSRYGLAGFFSKCRNDKALNNQGLSV